MDILYFLFLDSILSEAIGLNGTTFLHFPFIVTSVTRTLSVRQNLIRLLPSTALYSTVLL